MYLTIITPNKIVFEGNVYKAAFPGVAGSFQVLQDHAPLVSALQSGTISYGDEKQTYALSIEEGWMEVSNNSITVLATFVMSSH